MQQPEYIPLTEAAARLGVTSKTVKTWLREGRIEHLRIPYRTRQTYLVSAKDLDRFIEENKHPAQPKRSAGRPNTINLRSVEHA